MRAHQIYDVLEGLRDNERTQPVEASDYARGYAADFRRQDLAHHQPRDRSKAQWEAYHVNNQAN